MATAPPMDSPYRKKGRPAKPGLTALNRESEWRMEEGKDEMRVQWRMEKHNGKKESRAQRDQLFSDHASLPI